MTKRTIGLVLVALAGCGGGDASPRELCEDLVETLCGKAYECLTEAERAVLQLPPTEAACIAEYKVTYGCEEVTDDNACDGNQTYHADRAADCVDQTAGLSCEQVRTQDAANTPACNEICTVE
jgi:hypothetical protein